MEFIGFEVFASPPAKPLSASETISGADGTEPIYSGGDPDLALQCKKISKKDVVTKLKGLSELKGLCRTKGAPVLRTAVPHWLHLYHRLTFDQNRRVREGANLTHAALLAACPKAFLARLPSFLGPWFLSMADTAVEVAEAAKAAFRGLLVQDDKAKSVVSQHLPMLIRHLDLLFGFTPGSLVEARLCSADDSDDVHSRVTVSTLVVTARLVRDHGLLPAGPMSALLERRAWACLRSTRPPVRRAACELVREVCRVPSFAQDAAASAILAPELLGNLDAGGLDETWWEAVLAFAASCPESWGQAGAKVFPKLILGLRSGSVPGPCLLPIVASVPATITATYKGQGSAKFLRDMLEAAWQGGMRETGTPCHAAMVSALSEAAAFVLLAPRTGEVTDLLSPAVATTALEYFTRALDAFVEYDGPNCEDWAASVVGQTSLALSKLSTFDAAKGRACVAAHLFEPPQDAPWRQLCDAAVKGHRARRIVSLLTGVVAAGSGTSAVQRVETLLGIAVAFLLSRLGGGAKEAETGASHRNAEGVLELLNGLAPAITYSNSKEVAHACLDFFASRSDCDRGVRLSLGVGRIAMDQELATASDSGRSFWSSLVAICCEAYGGDRLEMLSEAVETLTPGVRATVFTSDALDSVITRALGSRLAGDGASNSAAIDRFLSTCLAHQTSAVRPLISERVLASLFQTCCDLEASSPSSMLWRLSHLLCALGPTLCTSSPHVEAAIRPVAIRLATVLYRCRVVPACSVLGSSLWDQYAAVLLDSSSVLSTFLAEVLPDLRAQLDGGLCSPDSVILSPSQWAFQAASLILLSCQLEERRGPSPAPCGSVVLAPLGIVDVLWWRQHVPALLSSDRTRGALAKMIGSLLAAVEASCLHRAIQASGSAAEISWGICTVGASCDAGCAASWRPADSLLPAHLFCSLPRNTAAAAILDQPPLQHREVSNVVDILGRDLLLQGVCFAINRLCREVPALSVQCTDDQVQAIVRELVIIAGFSPALASRTHTATSESPPPLAVGCACWYEHRAPGAPAQFNQATVVAIEENDVEKIVTIRMDDGGRERQTVLSRLVANPPNVVGAAEGGVQEVGGMAALQLELADAIDTFETAVRAQTSPMNVLCLRAFLRLWSELHAPIAVGPRQRMLSTMAAAHAHWTEVIIHVLERGAATYDLAPALAVFSSCVEDGGIDASSSARLTGRVLDALSSAGVPTPSRLAAMQWIEALAGRGLLAKGERSPRFGQIFRDIGEGALDEAAMFTAASCAKALYRANVLADDEKVIVASAFLLPAFLRCQELCDEANTVRAALRSAALKMCCEEVCKLGSDLDPSIVYPQTTVGPPCLTGLYLALRGNVPLVQLAAFAFLKRCREPMHADGAAASAASEHEDCEPNVGHDDSVGDEKQIVARRLVPLDLFEMLSNFSELSALDSAQNGETNGLSSSGSSFAVLLPWLLLLEHLEETGKRDRHSAIVLGIWARSLRQFSTVLTLCSGLYQDHVETLGRKATPGKPLFTLDARSLSQLWADPRCCERLGEVAAHALSCTICLLPSAVRAWWASDCDRTQGPVVQRFVETEMSELLASREVAALYEHGAQHDSLVVSGSVLTREISATYVKDECTLEVLIKLPPSYPLRNVEVDCQRRLGVTEARWRRWVLQIVSLLSNRDASVLDAILLWKKNVDKEFEGLEPCPICYSILHPKNLSLPSLECQTCQNKFHPVCGDARQPTRIDHNGSLVVNLPSPQCVSLVVGQDCLYKWFSTSHKSKCPLCQQPFTI